VAGSTCDVQVLLYISGMNFHLPFSPFTIQSVYGLSLVDIINYYELSVAGTGRFRTAG